MENRFTPQIEPSSNRKNDWIQLIGWVNPLDNNITPKLSAFQEIILLFYYLEGLLPNRPLRCSDVVFSSIYRRLLELCKIDMVPTQEIYALGNPWRISTPLIQFAGNTGRLHFLENDTVWEEPGACLEFTESRLTPEGLKYVFRHRLSSKYLLKAIL